MTAEPIPRKISFEIRNYTIIKREWITTRARHVIFFRLVKSACLNVFYQSHHKIENWYCTLGVQMLATSAICLLFCRTTMPCCRCSNCDSADRCKNAFFAERFHSCLEFASGSL